MFALPVDEGQTYLARTHPYVERLATDLMTTALDPLEKSVARRAGAMRTKDVSIRTTLLLCRFRFQLQTQGEKLNHTCLTEECALLGFVGAPERASWIDEDAAKRLLAAQPTGNINPDQATDFVGKVTANAGGLLPHIRSVMQERAAVLLDAHRRVRTAAKARGLRYQVTPQGEPDIIGLYVYLPE